jgi:hypothetical protein
MLYVYGHHVGYPVEEGMAHSSETNQLNDVSNGLLDMMLKNSESLEQILSWLISRKMEELLDVQIS